MKKNSVKEFENKRWREGDQSFMFRHTQAIEMIEKGQRVLDVACGDGLLMSALKKKGALVSGVDISDEAVKKCKAKGLDVSAVDIATEKLPFSDSTFDTVIMLDVLEHLYTPEVFLREAVRVSKKSIIISVPNFNSLPARLQVLFGNVPENNRPNKGHVFWFNYENLKRIIEDEGLHISELRVNTIFESIPLVGVFTKFFARVLPSILALSFVVKLEKI